MSSPGNLEFSKDLFVKAAVGSTAAALLFFHAFVDQFFVNLEGPVESAAYTLVLPIYTMVLAMSTAFGTAAAILVKRGIDSGDRAYADRMAITSIVYATGVGFVFSVALFFIMGYYFQFVSDEVAQCAEEFMTPFYSLYVALSLYGVLGALLLLDGGRRRYILTLVVGLAVNIVFDPILVDMFHLGIFGNGLGTALSFAASALLALEYFLSRRGSIRLSLRNFDPKFNSIRYVLNTLEHFFVVGFVKNFTELIMRFAVYTSYALSYGIPLLCTQLAYMFCLGSAEQLEGDYRRFYGERNIAAARHLFRSSCMTLFIAMLVFTAVVFILADPIVDIFTIHEGFNESRSTIVNTLRFLVLSTPVYGLRYVSAAVLAPTGHTIGTTAGNVARSFARMFLFVFLVGHSYSAAICMLFIERIVVGLGYFLYCRRFLLLHYGSDPGQTVGA